MKTCAMVMMMSLLAGGLGLGCGQEEDDNSCALLGDPCVDSSDCCGDGICENWECVSPFVCTATGYGCTEHSECCNFSEGTGWCVDGTCRDSCLGHAQCVSGCCAPTSVVGVSTCADASYCTCLPVRAYCSNASQCCDLMLCDVGTGMCCQQAGFGCIYDNDCCGTLFCVGNVCQ